MSKTHRCIGCMQRAGADAVAALCLRVEGGTKGTAEADITEPSRGKQQIANSLALLDHQKAKSIEHVTSIRVEADNLENDRRIEEENKRQDRLWRLQEEAVASGKANAAVEMRWNDLMEHNMPQDLNRVRHFAWRSAAACVCAFKLTHVWCRGCDCGCTCRRS